MTDRPATHTFIFADLAGFTALTEAGGGETLLTDTTRQAAGEVSGVQLHDRGKRTLKNVAEPLSLFAAMREGQRNEAASRSIRSVV